MGFLDRTLSDLSQNDLENLISNEVANQMPPIPAAVATLSDADVPVVHPPVLANGEVLLWDATQGGYVSADIGQIAGTIESTQITDHSISTPQLDANLVLAGTFATAASNPRVVVDATGITIYDASRQPSAGDPGNAVVVVPSDSTQSSTFAGNLSTGNLQVSGNLQISGTTNVMNKASVLTLNQGYANPTLAPTVSYSHEQSAVVGWSPKTDSSFAPTLFPANGLSYSAAGLFSQATWAYVDAPDRVGTISGSTAVIVISATTVGTVLANVRLKLTSPIFYTGAATIGSVVWVGYIASSTGKTKMVSIDPATGNVSASITLDASAFNLSASHGIAFYGDGTNVYLATWAGTGASKVVIRKFDTTGTLLATTTTTSGTSYNATDSPVIAAGAYDGTNHWITFNRNNGTFIEEYLGSTGVKVANSQMYFPATVDMNVVYGIGWDGTTMWGWPYDNTVAGMKGTLGKFSTLTWTPGTDKWYFAYEWNDGASHTTALGPISGAVDLSASYSSARQRGRFQITVPAFPAGTVQVDTYAANAGATPATSGMFLQATPTYVSSNTAASYLMTAYNAAGAAGNNANTFAGGTSTIVSTGPASATPWLLGGDGQFLVPVWTTANRVAGVVNGQLGWNTTLKGLDIRDGDSNWLTMYNPRDTEDIYDAILALTGGSGTTNMPIAYTLDPEAVNASLVFAGGDCRGSTFMVKRTVSTASVGMFVDLVSAGNYTGFVGFTLYSLNAAGDWVFVANSGAAEANAFTNALGWHNTTWKDAATGLVATPVTLSPGTVYVISLTMGTFGTTQPKIAGYNPGVALAASTNLINFGTSFTAKPQRNAQTAATKTAKITATIAVGNLASQTFIPLYAIW